MTYVVTWSNSIGDSDETGDFNSLEEAKEACCADIAEGNDLDAENHNVEIVWSEKDGEYLGEVVIKEPYLDQDAVTYKITKT